MRAYVVWERRNWRVALALVAILLGCCDDSSEPPKADGAGSDAEPDARSPVQFDEAPVTVIDRKHLEDVGTDPLDYGDPALWLCRPGNEPNPCLQGLDATEFLKDGTLRLARHVPAAAPAFDCFYTYPTVDVSGGGNTTDFLHIDLILDVLRAQAGRFSRICRVFAPLYRQRSFNSMNMLTGDEELAYRDVETAFQHFLEHDSKGRNFVLLGHSQGSGMLARVAAEHIDGDEELRSRLISAVLIGASLFAPEGRELGGTFQNLPFCTEIAQTGCVLAFDSFARDFPPMLGVGPGVGLEREGRTNGCTNPALFAGNPGRYRGSYLPLRGSHPLFVPSVPLSVLPAIETDTLLVRDLFTGKCVRGDGIAYLEIAPDQTEDDQRAVPAYRYPLQELLGIGLHTGDYNVVMDDLIDSVEQQAGAMPMDARGPD